MPFQRMWDSSCPQIYDKWESDEASWVIQDLLPEDDDEALNLMMENLLPDEETLFRLSGKWRENILKVATDLFANVAVFDHGKYLHVNVLSKHQQGRLQIAYNKLLLHYTEIEPDQLRQQRQIRSF